MTKEDWHYLWITELTKYGVTAESALRAFRTHLKSVDEVDIRMSPRDEAQKYLKHSYVPNHGSSR